MGGPMGMPDMMQHMMREGIDPQMIMHFMQSQGGMMPPMGGGIMPNMGPPGGGGGRGVNGPGGQRHGGGGGDRGGPGPRGPAAGPGGGGLGGGAGGGAGGAGRNQADNIAEQLSGQKRPLSDISNEQPDLVPGTLLQNESAEIDIKEDYFFAGPYKQERKLVFEVEQIIEAAEMKEELTVGDRTGKPHMCTW